MIDYNSKFNFDHELTGESQREDVTCVAATHFLLTSYFIVVIASFFFKELVNKHMCGYHTFTT